MDKIEKKKRYYPSGKIKSERCFKNGIPHGWHREWHENGVLASEMKLKDCVPDGIAKQWDENGKLMVSFEIKDGTGIEKTWMPEQGLWGETPWVNGKWTGRGRVYLEDGTFFAEDYWIRNEEVSKKQYLEACKTDPELPHYE